MLGSPNLMSRPLVEIFGIIPSIAYFLRCCWCGLLLVSLSSSLVCGQSSSNGDRRLSTLHQEASVHDACALVGVNDEGWLFGRGGQLLEPKRVVRWGSWPGVQAEQAVWLSDGSLLCGDVTIFDGQIQVQSEWLDCPVLNASIVRGLVLDPPASFAPWLALNERLRRLMDRKDDRQQDVVVLTDGQELSGIVRWPGSGAQASGEANKQLVELETAGRTLELELQQLRAVVFSPALFGSFPAELELPVMGLRDGSLLSLSSWKLVENELRFDTTVGLKLRTLDPPQAFLESVCYLREASEAVRYLSQLPVAQFKHLGDSTLQWDLGVDRDVLGRPLQIGAGSIDRGLAMHSASQVAFRWDGGTGRLLAEALLAPLESGAMRALGSVRCQVLLAKSGKLETALSFELARRGSALKSQVVDVDLAGAQLIVLVVEAGDFGQFGDHVTWADARIATP